MTSLSLLLRLLLGIAFITGGIWNYNQIKGDNQLKQQAKQWQDVSATITQVEAVRGNARQHSAKKNHSSHTPTYGLKIKYSYTWQNATYHGKLSIPTQAESTSDAFSEYPNLTKGSTLSLRVNPLNPSQSIPNKLDVTPAWLSYAYSAGLALAGLFLTVKTFLTIGKQQRKP
jgi:hypothetical protein